mmetsp:Transcript_4962/g.10790  ORF Transcript_4962/g.10790 Transcript_4962/m.10790 type:complete len:391 (-) Transcript_4962:439-1611(-)
MKGEIGAAEIELIAKSSEDLVSMIPPIVSSPLSSPQSPQSRKRAKSYDKGLGPGPGPKAAVSSGAMTEATDRNDRNGTHHKNGSSKRRGSGSPPPPQQLHLDLSVNSIGWHGLSAITMSMENRAQQGLPAMAIELEGNSVMAEVLNSVTHGVGILLCLIGQMELHRKAAELDRHRLACTVYSLSLITLYTASTLYHSFFMLQKTRDIFLFLDHAAIYLLIAGTYTPFLVICFPDNKLWSQNLLAFLWLCAICGITCDAIVPASPTKKRFSLCLYLAMGWSVSLCCSDLYEVLPKQALYLVLAGGVAYTAGVPFFVMNRNYTHAIWHVFVLAGRLQDPLQDSLWSCALLAFNPTITSTSTTSTIDTTNVQQHQSFIRLDPSLVLHLPLSHG